MSAPAAKLPPGEIQFFDAFQPGIADGTYRVSVAQTISASGGSIAPIAQEFVVQGPRFAIDDGDVHTKFPPNGATSTFEDVLPHIVLNKRLLPWERRVPGAGENVPWLALLVFQQGELLGDANGGNFAQTQPVAKLLESESGVRKPALIPKTVLDEERTASCQTIMFRSSLFGQIAPTARELPYLAHARQVNTGAKALFGLKDDGWFSVVVANRFPQPGTPTVAAKCVVHLVSLEGFGDLLGGVAPVTPPEEKIQMVTLASWTFSCLGNPAQTFGGLAQNLAYDAADDWRAAAAQLLRLPLPEPTATDDATKAVRVRLQDGYVALGYHASSGEDGFAWYRGPLTPVVPNAVPGANTFQTSDAAIIYDPATGVFDHSLSTAWQAGRALALGSQPFATALMRVRQKASSLLEKLSAPPAADVHEQLAALFSGGAIEAIGAASSSGEIAPVQARPLLRAARPAPLKSLRSLLATPAVQAQLTGKLHEDPDAIAVTDWLGQLLLLRNVPFVHLVPDARMLPIESIRFFYLDPNWTSALMMGALSVGVGTSRESAIQNTLTRQLQQMAATAARAWRGRELDPNAAPLPAPEGPLAGFLLRSGLASGWPGLVVLGTRNNQPVPLLRMEHLGPNVLLCLFNGVPDTVTLKEPQEGLEFGVDDFGRIDTRTIAAKVITQGAKVFVYDPEKPDTATAALRAGGQRVLNLSSASYPAGAAPAQPKDLVGLLAQALKDAPEKIGPARFAVQMVKGPEQIQFSFQPEKKPAPATS